LQRLGRSYEDNIRVHVNDWDTKLKSFLKMAQLITHEELKSATGFDNNAALEKCLRNQKIPVLYGKDGHVFTTLDAINNALGLKSIEQSPDEIEFIR
jgi:hypothetical protein